MVANLLVGSDAEIDFNSLQRIAPEIGRQDDLLEDAPSPRLIKSHARYDRRFTRTIYVLRDGRDSYISYYEYLYGKSGAAISFEDFIRTGAGMTCRWSEHTRSWLNRQLDPSELILIRYEDLLHNTQTELEKIADFIGLDASPADVKTAVERCSFSNMSKAEHEKGDLLEYERKSKFVRKGVSGQWKEYYSEQAKDLFKKYDGDALIEFGYEQGFDW